VHLVHQMGKGFLQKEGVLETYAYWKVQMTGVDGEEGVQPKRHKKKTYR
jgi:hypothetical protein